jgi:hypothetical protein
MNHKRKKRRNIRAGCKMCKPWKVNGYRTERPEGEKFSDHKKRIAAAVAIAAALTGCATTRYAPTYCLTRAQLEQLKAQEPGKIHSQLNGDAAHDVGPLAGSAIRLRAYADGLLVVLGGCIDPNEGSRSK